MDEGDESRRPAVYTIAPGRPFLDALAAGVLERIERNPLALSEVTVLLPNRRACRALQESFLGRAEGRALLLPRMRPLGDIDGELDEVATSGLELPPAIQPLARRIRLMRLILGWAKANGRGPLSADQAVRLAGELAHFLDQVQTEQLSSEALDRLVPEDYAHHWQITLDFLKLVTEHWPVIVSELGFIDPAMRRNLALETLAETWRARPPSAPVIAAGSTGSIPATADLLAVVARLPQGSVVLPGLDAGLDEADWEALGPSHPQYGLKLLLETLDLARAEVEEWPSPGVTGTAPARARLISEALRPAREGEAGEAPAKPRPEALEGVRRIDCPGLKEEAGVIALLMREALDTSGRRAALVTLDRALARRVVAELGRYGIEVDDSAGRPLAETPPGAFLRLTAELAASGLAPVPFLAALKHPLAAGGEASGAFKRKLRRLERAVLRGPRPAPGFDGLKKALERSGGEASLGEWLGALETITRPFLKLMTGRPAGLDALVRAHLAFAEALAAGDDATGPERLWAGEAGEAAAGFASELIESAAACAPISGASYPALLESLMERRVVRPAHGGHSRLFIWGPLEARLQQVDLMILGGLNEGSWPLDAAADPWMSRPMRGDFGLPSLERRIGLSAHDFAQCFSTPQVVLTRSCKVEGTPTVPSRWLTRLETLLVGLGLEGAIEREAGKWLAWQKRLDWPRRMERIAPPEPRPPVSVRPRRLSVTQVETWRRDPYAIYARHILKLKPLEDIDADPGALERGGFIHEALERFVASTPDALPDDALERLVEAGRAAFGPELGRPGVWAFWWPRFLRIAEWFVATERDRREGAERTIATEVRGELTLAGPAGPFTVTARADRIDRAAGGGLVIIDYKTGMLPKTDHVRHGLSPQLPLEALIAEAGGFEGLSAGEVAELAYWRLSGGEPPGEIKPLKEDVAMLVQEARKGLESLIATFDDASTPYLSRPRPDAPPQASDYDHLARVKEWSAGEEQDGP